MAINKKYVVLEHLTLPDRGFRFFSINTINNVDGHNGELWYKEVGFVDTVEEAQKIMREVDPKLVATMRELEEYWRKEIVKN